MNQLKIIQHNVLKWSWGRRSELSNCYSREDPDIILLNATGILDTDQMKIYKYKVIQRNYRNENHAGIAVAIKDNIRFKLIENFQEDFIAIEVETEVGPIIIGTTYLPPRRNYPPRQDINGLMQRGRPVYLIGDLNLRHPIFGHGDANNKGRYIADQTNRGHIKHLGPDFPTLTSRNGKPDIILANRWANLNYVIEEGPLTTSDHIPIIVTLSTRPIRLNTMPRKNLKRANWEIFKESIEREVNNMPPEIKEPGHYTANQISQRLETWLQAVKKGEEDAIPNQALTFNSHHHNSERMTRLQITYREIKNQIDIHGANPRLRNAVKTLQENLLEEYNRLNYEHWEGIVSRLNTMKMTEPEFWNSIRRLRGNKNAKNKYLINNQNVKITDSAEKARLLRDTWEDVFQITNEENMNFDRQHEQMVLQHLQLNRERITPYEMSDISRLDEASVLTKPITITDIKQVIKGFKQKAPGPSGVTKKHLSNIPDNAMEMYRNILNMTYSMGIIPEKCKKGHTAMLPKENNTHDPKKFRPITLLEVFGKVLEKIVKDRLYKYLEDNNILPDNQYGFRRNRGTQTAIISIYEKIALNQKIGGQTNIVCRDVQKAFDKIWHEGLKFKILQLNLPPVLEKTLCNFLDNREINIKFEGQLSAAIQIKSGVPQGSVLSPIMYIYYIADMPRAGPDCENMVFADDVTQVIQYNHKSKRALALRTTREISKINEYERKWKIATNKNKFRMLSISKAKPHEIRINNRILPFSNQCKILGFTLRRTGFNLHIKSRIAIAAKTSTRLQRFQRLKIKTKMSLYKSMVRPVWEYPCVPMCLISKTNYAKIQAFQNRYIRRAIRSTQRYEDPNAYQDEHENIDMEEAHEAHRLEAVNTRMYRLAQKAWEKMEIHSPEIVERSREDRENDERPEHYWWRKIHTYIAGDEPEPIYIYGRR